MKTKLTPQIAPVQASRGAGFNHPYVLMSFLVILWGSFAAVSTLTLGYVDNFQVLFYMFGSAFVVMTIMLIQSGQLVSLRALTWTELLKLTLYAVPSFLYYFLYILALRLIPAVEASMLNYLFPIMIVIFAVPINGEKLSVAKILSILLGFAGMAVILTNGHPENMKLSNLTGDILAVSAAVMWGIFSNLGKRNRINSFLSNYIYTAVSFILSAVALLLFSDFMIPGIQAATGLLWLGLSNIVLGFYLWFIILKNVSIVMVSSFSFITPFVTLVFIMLLLGERITYIQVIGLLIIAASIYISSAGKAASKDKRSIASLK